MSNLHNILFIQFKFIGDIVFLTPTLKAYKNKFPNHKIHLLVSKDVVPLVYNLPYIDYFWAFPRIRGSLNLFSSIIFILKMRKYNFDFSLDFVGNDRGSMITRLIHSKLKIGLVRPNSNPFQSTAYDIKIYSELLPKSYILFNWYFIQRALNFTFSQKIPKVEIKKMFF
jgi:ADP-heptose:LPS heptosyltransferase